MAIGIESLTPMMKQYWEIKQANPDALLFFRLGDFYEMFFEDAVVASKILNIALTSRNKNSDESVPLCGVPFHSANNYIAKLVKHGCRVAICEQVEDPKLAKGLVKREVVRIVSPGLFDDLENLKVQEPNYLVAIGKKDNTYALAAVDILSGELIFGNFKNHDDLTTELVKLAPRELIIVGLEEKEQRSILLFFPTCRLEPRVSGYEANFDLKVGLSSELLQQIGDEAWLLKILLEYASQVGVHELRHLGPAYRLTTHEFMAIDERTVQHLELLQSQTGKETGTLFWVLNLTATPMGARLLRKWILFPLLDLKSIELRQQSIAECLEDWERTKKFIETASLLGDLERITGRIALGNAHPRDLAQLRDSLHQVEVLRVQLTKPYQSELLQKITAQLPQFSALLPKLESALVDSPPISFKTGGIFQKSYSAELDELHALSSDSKQILSHIEQQERQRTGINTLKIKYNQVFGYYLEVTHTHQHKVPADYIRKQTLANAERYITEELKTLEDKILGAEEKMQRLEEALFIALREEVRQYVPSFKLAAQSLAHLDVIVSLARAAKLYHYVCPQLTHDSSITLKDSRHPVLERVLPAEKFIPNDFELNGESERMFLITGPNMAGKSTLMRQLALCVLMAQMGSFIPATYAKIGITDRIMSRLGASDDLAGGMSTFMVEMVETAHILKQASSLSLVLLDEIGRGTSTYDGLAIAWAVAEYLATQTKCRTLFATHYHELTELESLVVGIVNYQVAVKEWNGEILFLRKLLRGSCSRSYGLEVARLAGIPDAVLLKARAKLQALEIIREQELPPKPQFELFNLINPCHSEPSRVKNLQFIAEIKKIDFNELTPMQALTYLYELKNKLE